MRNAEKAQIRAYNEITRADYTPESIEAAIGKLWDTAVSSRDAEVGLLSDARDILRASVTVSSASGQRSLDGIAETLTRMGYEGLREQLAAERTRADKAEAEVARLLEVIERAYQAGLMHSGKAAARILGNEIAAVPVEPQGDRPHYEIIVPGCDCVGCFGEALATRTGLLMPTIEQELATITSASSPHFPVERWVQVGEDVGGVPVVTGVEHQIRCGCREDLGADWGTEGHGDV